MKQYTTYPEFKIGDVVVCSEPDAIECLTEDDDFADKVRAVQGVIITAERYEKGWTYCVEAVLEDGSKGHWYGTPDYKLTKTP